MSSQRQKCGLGSLLSMSCRGRAEAFAKSLQSKLRSLGSQNDNDSVEESSWLAANGSQVALSQPRHNLELDIELESPGSPVLEQEDERQALINKDNLVVSISNIRHSHSNDCQCPRSKEHQRNISKTSNSNDSDSDSSFYDTENDVEHRLGGYLNGDNNSESSRSQETISTTQDGTFATTSECTPQPTSSSSGDVSTLSLRDEDCPSLEINGSLMDVSIVCGELNDNCIRSNETTSEDIREERTSNKETHHDREAVYKKETLECERTEELCNELEINTRNSSSEFASSAGEDEDEESEERTPRVRRCSSLKSGKTPPSTPGGKKIVRFADVLGLDLADVRTFLDEIPKIPVSAFVDLPEANLDDSSSSPSPSNLNGVKLDKFLMPLFQQPGGLPNFLDLVREKQVCLENAFVDDPVMLSISGTVRVRNLDFHKSLHIRYSLDSWKTFADVQGTYVNNSCDGFSDKFSFLLYAHTLSLGQRIEFACRFQCKGCQYWDNNNGANYCFQCLPTTGSSSCRNISPLDDWSASFY